MIFLEKLLSGTLPFCLLTVAGIYLSFKNVFPQISRFGESMKLSFSAFKSCRNSEEFTSLKAACTSLSATVGTGNIAGVAGALSIGGPGAVFWMWISALFGMVIKAAEITLGVLFREKSSKGFAGGPMYYLKKGIGNRFDFAGVIFAVSAIPAVFFSGNMTQTNSAIITLSDNTATKLFFGVLFCVICYFSISGSMTKIAAITEKLVPVMSILYIVLCGIIILKNAPAIPSHLYAIFKGAFCPKAVTGGAVGSITVCIFTGASRGVFSNESGLGTSAMAHSVAVDAKPETQGLYGIFEVFADTIVLCTLTALTILCSGVKINYGSIASTELVGKSLFTAFGTFANIALGIMMCLFAISSIIGWAIYGKLCWQYLFGQKGDLIFSLIYPLCCITGVLLNEKFIWQMAGICNGIMLCINLIGVLLLSDKVKLYLKKEKKIGKQKN